MRISINTTTGIDIINIPIETPVTSSSGLVLPAVTGCLFTLASFKPPQRGSGHEGSWFIWYSAMAAVTLGRAPNQHGVSYLVHLHVR